MQKLQRIVVKVGTSTLTHANGRSNIRAMEGLVKVLSDIMNQDIQVALVSSGAIGVGVGKLRLKSKPKGHARQAGRCHRGPVRADVHV